jgi:hypothetical protein
MWFVHLLDLKSYGVTKKWVIITEIANEEDLMCMEDSICLDEMVSLEDHMEEVLVLDVLEC